MTITNPMSEHILEQIEQEHLDNEQQGEKRRKEIIAKVKALINEEKENRYDFPINVFPEKLREILQLFHDCYGLPIDYFGLGALTAASSIIGNAYAIRYRHGQVYPCILYSAIVGNSSIGKTPAIKLCLGPIFDMEKEYQKEYLEQLEMWKQECYENSISNTRQPDPPQPKQKEILINDATTEAINLSLTRNPRGLLLYRDELSGWINSLNQYRKGSDTEFWLSNWSNATSKVSRASKDPLYIKKPNVDVLGGIQPAVLERNMAGDGREENGFLARVLFAYPKEMVKPYESERSPDISVFDRYKKICFYLRDLPSRIEPPATPYEDWTVESIYLDLDDDARIAYKAFHRDNTDQINASNNDTMKSILGKMENYCLRFALILELLNISCENYQDEINLSLEEVEELKISEQSIIRAIELIKYFKSTATYVLTRFESPVNQLPIKQQSLYKALPEEFETGEAVKIGASKELELGERTVKRLLIDKTLFKKVRRGVYEKLYI
ncbi:MAG: DUF3987 domain-containing protein [Saprospiraceae bacterium]|nr:DUF3987 domain-containing protein [Saprospiraceae bacterium]